MYRRKGKEFNRGDTNDHFGNSNNNPKRAMQSTYVLPSQRRM